MNRLQKRNTSKTTNQSERSETTLFSPTHQAQITTAIDSTHHQENSSLLANTESIIDNSAHLDTTPVLTLTTSTLSINETRNHSATQAQSSTIEQFLETQIEIVAQLDYEPIDFSEPMEDEDEDQMEHQRQKSFIQASTNSLLKQSVSILQRPVKLQVLSDMKFYGHDDRSRNANAITQSKVKKIETSFVDLKWSHDRHTFQDEADDKLEAEGRLIVDRVAQKKVVSFQLFFLSFSIRFLTRKRKRLLRREESLLWFQAYP